MQEHELNSFALVEPKTPQDVQVCLDEILSELESINKTLDNISNSKKGT
jgi:hypothetical protein